MIRWVDLRLDYKNDNAMKYDLSIIIPTKDRGEIFYQTLKSVLSSVININSEIIIINDSTSLINIDHSWLNVKVYKNKGKGVASARNRGASKASSDILLFLDDDILINEMTIKRLLKHFETDPNNIYLPDWEYPENLNLYLLKKQFGRFIIKNNLNCLRGWMNINSWCNNETIEIPHGASFCLLIHKSKFYSIGGYNEHFPYAGAEDFDFCERLKKTGTRFFVDNLMLVYHNEADRTMLENWLERKKRDSYTKKTAFTLGYAQFQLRYSYLPSFILNTIYNCKFVLFIIIRLIPNISIFDKIYAKIVHLLTAAYIYTGYKKM